MWQPQASSTCPHCQPCSRLLLSLHGGCGTGGFVECQASFAQVWQAQNWQAMPFLMAPCCGGEGERDLASHFSQKVQESGGLAVRCLLDSRALIIFCMQMPVHSRRRGKDGREMLVGSNIAILFSCGFDFEERKDSQSISGLSTAPMPAAEGLPQCKWGSRGTSGLAVSTGLSVGSAGVSLAAQILPWLPLLPLFSVPLQQHWAPAWAEVSRGRLQVLVSGRGAWINPCCTSPSPGRPAPRPPARPPPLCRLHPARQVSEPWMRARALLMDTTDGAWKSAEWASATGHFLGPNKSLQISQQKSQRSQRESVICHLPRVCVGVAALPCSSSPAPEPTRWRSPTSPPARRHPAAWPTHGGAGATAVVLGLRPAQLVPCSGQTQPRQPV